jgi:hypothetical protein
MDGDAKALESLRLRLLCEKTKLVSSALFPRANSVREGNDLRGTHTNGESCC